MMNSKLCLSAGALEKLSTGNLSPDDLLEIESHVDGCEHCREVLHQVEADTQWKDKIVPILSADDHLAFQQREGSEADESSSLDSLVALLGPTDNPEMLGRIGAYEIMGVIGRGGMGVVFKAFDPALRRFVAIKMLLPHLAASGSARKRFAREGRAAAAVIDDHVMPIHSVDQWRGTPYLVTPYSRGTTLQKRIQDQGPLETKEVLRIATQTARGLEAAHAQGLVHRDVKPSNILLDGTVERAMLTDFGLARAADDASITHTGMISGTPQYMSPEQVRGETVDARSDLFGLGCVMYMMCTGRPPFRAENSYAILRLITDEDPRAIREINPEIPKWLSEIIAKLMSKTAEDRFEHAGEVADLCEACLAHLQQPDVVPLPVSPSLAALPSFAGATVQETWWSRKSTLGVLAATILAMAGTVFWQATQPRKIEGRWLGPQWGNVVLKETQPRQYEGEFTRTRGKEKGKIDLKWSRGERRFSGTWSQTGDVSGKLSLHLVGEELHGAWTTEGDPSQESKTPKLAELIWKRSEQEPVTPLANETAAERLDPQSFKDQNGTEKEDWELVNQSGDSISFDSPLLDPRVHVLADKAMAHVVIDGNRMKGDGNDLVGISAGATDGLRMGCAFRIHSPLMRTPLSAVTEEQSQIGVGKVVRLSADGAIGRVTSGARRVANQIDFAYVSVSEVGVLSEMREGISRTQVDLRLNADASIPIERLEKLIEEMLGIGGDQVAITVLYVKGESCYGIFPGVGSAPNSQSLHAMQKYLREQTHVRLQLPDDDDLLEKEFGNKVSPRFEVRAATDWSEGGEVPKGSTIYAWKGHRGKTSHVLVNREGDPLIQAGDLTSVKVLPPKDREIYGYSITVQLNTEAAKRLAKETAKLIQDTPGTRLAVIVDGSLKSAARLQSTISERFNLTGHMARHEAVALAHSFGLGVTTPTAGEPVQGVKANTISRDYEELLGYWEVVAVQGHGGKLMTLDDTSKVGDVLVIGHVRTPKWKQLNRGKVYQKSPLTTRWLSEEIENSWKGEDSLHLYPEASPKRLTYQPTGRQKSHFADVNQPPQFANYRLEKDELTLLIGDPHDFKVEQGSTANRDSRGKPVLWSWKFIVPHYAQGFELEEDQRQLLVTLRRKPTNGQSSPDQR